MLQGLGSVVRPNSRELVAGRLWLAGGNGEGRLDWTCLGREGR